MDLISNVQYYGVSEEFDKNSEVEVELGRLLLQSDYDYASNSIVIGIEVADKLSVRGKSVGKRYG
jgi:hypothetical protein